MIARQFSLPQELQDRIGRALEERFHLKLQDSRKLAEAVKKLSDFFIASPEDPTPWSENWAQIAYLVYFLPLNFLRVQAVIQEARKRNFFQGLEDVIDFGAGFGTASLALQKEFRSFELIERAHSICSAFQFVPGARWTDRAPSLRSPSRSLAVFSYSLTELESLPMWALNAEALMILEPATQQDGRKLLQLRQNLLEKGFFAWAPCTHQQACPLLTQSKTDWCHDRIHFAAPEWFLKLEEHLPMKNKTLTTSYLLLRKTAPAPMQAARTVGDLLEEKGKDRQMVCRGPEREFLAWMHKHGPHQEIPRGVLLKIPADLPKVANEIRLSAGQTLTEE